MSTPIVDCHTHTSFSDGTSTFEQNVAAAARAGVRVLACPSPLVRIAVALLHAQEAPSVQKRHGNASVVSQAHKKGRRPKAPALCPLDVSQRQPPR